MQQFIEIEDDYIAGVVHAPTHNVGPQINPKYLILYNAVNTAPALVKRFTEDEDVKESAHLIINDLGEIIQLAPFTVKTWHAGASYWQGHHGLNGFAIGIYLASPFRNVTMEQRAVLHNTIPALVQHYNLRDIVEHARPGYEPVDVTEFKQYVEYGNADSVGRFVATADIVIRGGPDVHFNGIDTIKAGEGVKVLRYSVGKDWAFILYERKDQQPRHGWTHESFLRRL
jgi:hypothetical protein